MCFCKTGIDARQCKELLRTSRHCSAMSSKDDKCCLHDRADRTFELGKEKGALHVVKITPELDTCIVRTASATRGVDGAPKELSASWEDSQSPATAMLASSSLGYVWRRRTAAAATATLPLRPDTPLPHNSRFLPSLPSLQVLPAAAASAGRGAPVLHVR